MTLPRLLLALVLTAMAVRGAAADDARDAPDAATRTAKRHFERGQKLYALTRFSDALDEYQQAFDARPLPDFLFNIGQCYRNLGDYDAAIFSYKKYLTLAPEASNRAQVEQLIEYLQTRKDRGDTRRLGLQPRTGPPEPAAREAHPAQRPIYRTWWFWTGVSVAVLGTGGIAIYEVTRPHSPPSTDLGNIVFGK